MCVSGVLALTGCGARDREPLRLQATVAFPPRDTIRFSLPAVSHRCRDGHSLLLEAADPQGYGVLARLHFGDSLIAGSYPIAAPGDSVTIPASQVAVRYLLRDVSHGFAVDSGSVSLQRDGRTVTAHIRGSGLENAIRTPTWIDFRDVPLSPPPDTVPCTYAP